MKTKTLMKINFEDKYIEFPFSKTQQLLELLKIISLEPGFNTNSLQEDFKITVKTVEVK